MFFELKMKIKSGFSNAPIVMKVCTRLVMIFSDGFGRLEKSHNIARPKKGSGFMHF